MPWAITVILLIMVAVIILSNLGRAARLDQRRTPPRPLPPRNDLENRPAPPPLSGPKTRRSPSEVERFLEEINRRRLETAERRRRPEEAVRKPPAPPPPPQAVTAADRPPIAPPPMPAPPAAARQARQARQVVLLEEQQSPPPRRPTEREGTARAVPPAREAPAVKPPPLPAQQSAAEAPPHVAPIVTRWAEPPVALRLRDMLKDPQSMRAAMMLREVLDPPLAFRKRRPAN